MDEGGLADLLHRHAERHSVPGAAVGILRRGVVTTACYGVADVTTGEPVVPETRFSAGSLTKSMVATVIARLAESGRLSLEDRVAVHVPELQHSAWARTATVRDLLANRSGLPLRRALEFGFADRADGEDALARFAADLAAAGQPSAFWSYSNAGWCLLGRVIETVTGTSWDDAMARHFGDAGMCSTAFTADAEMARRAVGHEVTSQEVLPVAPMVSRAYAPAGIGTVSTVDDLLRFAALHLQDPTLVLLREIHAEVSICSWFDAWCLGWGQFDWTGGPVWGWDGVVRGERAVLRLMPAQQAAVVLLTNASTGRAMYRSLFADLMPSWFGLGGPPVRPDPSPGSAGDLARFAGVYGWPDERVEITATESHLVVKSNEGEKPGLPLDGRTFLVDPLDPDNPTVTFGAFDAAGRPSVVYLMLWALPRLDG